MISCICCFLCMWVTHISLSKCRRELFPWWVPQIESRVQAANWIQIGCHVWNQTNTPWELWASYSNFLTLCPVAHTHKRQRPCEVPAIHPYAHDSQQNTLYHFFHHPKPRVTWTCFIVIHKFHFSRTKRSIEWHRFQGVVELLFSRSSKKRRPSYTPVITMST